jgi:hypothetical protein
MPYGQLLISKTTPLFLVNVFIFVSYELQHGNIPQLDKQKGTIHNIVNLDHKFLIQKIQTNFKMHNKRIV